MTFGGHIRVLCPGAADCSAAKGALPARKGPPRQGALAAGVKATGPPVVSAVVRGQQTCAFCIRAASAPARARRRGVLAAGAKATGLLVVSAVRICPWAADMRLLRACSPPGLPAAGGPCGGGEGHGAACCPSCQEMSVGSRHAPSACVCVQRARRRFAGAGLGQRPSLLWPRSMPDAAARGMRAASAPSLRRDWPWAATKLVVAPCHAGLCSPRKPETTKILIERSSFSNCLFKLGVRSGSQDGVDKRGAQPGATARMLCVPQKGCVGAAFPQL